MWGRLVLSDRAFLIAYETVEVRGSGVRRTAYSYYLIVDGAEEWGFDRDEIHDPPEHGHVGAEHARVDAGRIEFHEVVEKAWEIVSALEPFSPTEPHE